jgi:hypothetical protein
MLDNRLVLALNYKYKPFFLKLISELEKYKELNNKKTNMRLLTYKAAKAECTPYRTISTI